MGRHLHHGEEGIDILIFLQIGHLPGRHDNIDNLDDLRRLNADTGEADPRAVAGAVVLAEKHQSHQQHQIHQHQQLPLPGHQVHIDHREQHEGNDTQDHGPDLHRQILGRDGHIPAALVHAGDRLFDHGDAKDRTQNTDHQQEDIRPLEEFLYVWFQSDDCRHRLSMDGLGTI